MSFLVITSRYVFTNPRLPALSLPEATGVGVSSYPLGRSQKRFRDANSFIPERWLDDPRFVDDRRDIVQAFNFGPRNCLGKVRLLYWT